MDARKGIQSIEIGGRLLRELETGSQPMTLTEIARATGLSLSSARFYLISLTRIGLVAQTPSGVRYQLGPAALRMGLAALAQSDVLELARAELQSLRDRTGETVFLSVWSERGPVVVNRVDGERIAPLGIRVGSLTPLTHSATGKVFLAYLPRTATRVRVQKELKSGASASRDRAVERLSNEVRARGMSTNIGGVIPGIAAIAAPVVDYEGALRCVVTVMGQANRLNIGYGTKSARELLATAQHISRSAGFVGDIWHSRKAKGG
jgi:DNA-binding IclR family transcriptional regulator